MRLCLFIVFALCLGPVRCNVGIINGTEIQRLYSKLLNRMIQVLEDQVEKKDNPSPEEMDRISCINGLNALFKNLGSSWGLAMVDSASKLQSAIVSWNFMDLGDYDQCINVRVRPTEENPELPEFTGRHCLVTNRIYNTNATIEHNGRSLRLMDVFGHPYIPLTLAHCYPSLCKPYVIQDSLNGVLSLMEHDLEIFGLGLSNNVTVDPKDCHDAEGAPYDALDWIVLIIILLFVLLGLFSTAIDYYFKSNNINPSSSTMKLLGSFSFYTNTKKLLFVGTVPEIIPSLNGMKFFSMCWVIFTHEYFFHPLSPIRNINRLYVLDGVLRELVTMLVLNGPLSVDTFFFISGLLNMYGFLTLTTASQRYTVRDVLKGYMHRYLRLTPAYLMVLGFSGTWYYHIRDGPLWDRFVGMQKDACRQNYWTNILYLNNYLPNFCNIQSWYLATDMQLFWLSPFVMYPLWRWPKYGRVQFLVLTIASIISPFLVSWYGHISSPIPRTNNFDRKMWEFTVLYLPLHTRIVSYLMGIGASWILFQNKQGTLSLDFNLWKRTIGWLLTATMMLYAMFGGYEVFRMDYNYDRFFSAFYIGFQRFFWSVGLLWMVLMCEAGYGGFINTFLSWKVFTPLSKISYCAFLTHLVVLMCCIGARRNSFYYNHYDQIVKFLGDTVMSIFSGLVLTLLVEMPMLNVQKLVLGGGRKKHID